MEGHLLGVVGEVDGTSIWETRLGLSLVSVAHAFQVSPVMLRPRQYKKSASY
jgi:hypothetical protein